MTSIARYLQDLAQQGITVPARPVPPFDPLPASPTSADLDLDRLYQVQLVDWIEKVALLHLRHFPPNR